MKRKSLLLVALAVLMAATALPLRYSRAADAAAPERKPKATFEVYQDKSGEYRWRLRAQNTKVLATGSEGYKEKRSCLASIESVKRDAPLRRLARHGHRFRGDDPAVREIGAEFLDDETPFRH